MSTQQKISSDHKNEISIDIHTVEETSNKKAVNGNTHRTSFTSCARGKGLQIYLSNSFNKRKELYSNSEEVIRNEYVADDDATITKLKHQESSVESVPFVLNEQSLIVNEISNQPPQNQLTTNCNLEKIFLSITTSNNWNNVYARYFDHDVVYGNLDLSALYAHHFDYRIELSMRRALRHTHLVGVGEIGLDFEIENRPSDDIQIKAFSAQLRIAKEYKLSVVVTSRKSFIATLSCLTSELNNDHPVHWRNFVYGEEELYMLISKMNNVYFGCSLQIFSNKQMQLNIEQIPISRILPESVAPHISIKECPHVYATHPLFVIQVYKYIAHKFNLNIRQAAEQLVENHRRKFHRNVFDNDLQRNDIYSPETNISQACQVTMIYKKNLSSSIKIDEILIKQKQNPNDPRNIVYKGYLKKGDTFSFKSQRLAQYPFDIKLYKWTY
ncbi:unnamed protein product [Adineta steineri]|uniref:Uncharacterized protein n=1 Tax=Adineta steineri TaxID=433720 RepID=A0A816BHY7_9BILA|nr:unnamed protein product [Adineta steineri]CAF1609507.1 unnamed protein product [Adineta steineri]